MEQSGEYRIAVGRQQVWSALNDPEILGACIAGCQQVDKLDDTHFDVRVKAKVGPVSATFSAALELTDIVSPESYTIHGNAKGGAAGFAKGSATVRLTEEAGITTLSYGVQANVGGKLAQVGSRLVDGAARKMADDFFAAFSKSLDPQAGAAVSDVAPTADASKGPATAAAPAPRSYEPSGRWQLWVVAFVVLATAAILTF